MPVFVKWSPCLIGPIDSPSRIEYLTAQTMSAKATGPSTGDIESRTVILDLVVQVTFMDGEGTGTDIKQTKL